jgi:DtxR family Mn-dependent transcriptional regulator
MYVYSFTEENYLKIIYHLSSVSGEAVQTNAIAEGMQTKPASVTDMIRKLAIKKMVNYVKYQGVTLTESGKAIAVEIIRKHRLWEVFLVKNLNFKWDEVHDIAEQLEHINSVELIDKLDEYLGHPKLDPHGDPIPDKDGVFEESNLIKLNKLAPRTNAIIVGVSEHSSSFLKYLDQVGLILGKQLQLIEVIDFDGSIEILIDKKKVLISREVAKHILIKL